MVGGLPEVGESHFNQQHAHCTSNMLMGEASKEIANDVELSQGWFSAGPDLDHYLRPRMEGLPS